MIYTSIADRSAAHYIAYFIDRERESKEQGVAPADTPVSVCSSRGSPADAVHRIAYRVRSALTGAARRLPRSELGYQHIASLVMIVSRSGAAFACRRQVERGKRGKVSLLLPKSREERFR